MKAPNALTLQRVKRVQHVIPEGLTNGAELGDEVTSLCGETYRLRYKDDPNYLTCGMCSLLLIREYRSLLTEHNEVLGLVEEFMQKAVEQERAAEGEPTTEPSTVDGQDGEESDGTRTVDP